MRLTYQLADEGAAAAARNASGWLDALVDLLRHGGTSADAMETLIDEGWGNEKGDAVFGAREVLALVEEMSQREEKKAQPPDSVQQDQSSAQSSSARTATSPVSSPPTGSAAGKPRDEEASSQSGGLVATGGDTGDTEAEAMNATSEGPQNFAQRAKGLIAKAQGGRALTAMEREQVAQLLGEEVALSLVAWGEAMASARRRGMMEPTSTRLTSQALRVVGEQLFGRLVAREKARSGRGHRAPESRRNATAGERSDEVVGRDDTESWDVALVPTLVTALRRHTPSRGRSGRSLDIGPQDWRVYAPEPSVRGVTVVALDLSRSMPLQGYFAAAKEMAILVDAAVRWTSHHDEVIWVGFNQTAWVLDAKAVLDLEPDVCVYGTNVEHALTLGRSLLASYGGWDRHLILVTDGEPTAHMEHGRPVFAYPPQPLTRAHALAAATALRRSGARLTIAALGEQDGLTTFVGELAHAGGGDVLLCDPKDLGPKAVAMLGRGANRPRETKS